MLIFAENADRDLDRKKLYCMKIKMYFLQTMTVIDHKYILTYFLKQHLLEIVFI